MRSRRHYPGRHRPPTTPGPAVRIRATTAVVNLAPKVREALLALVLTAPFLGALGLAAYGMYLRHDGAICGMTP